MDKDSRFMSKVSAAGQKIANGAKFVYRKAEGVVENVAEKIDDYRSFNELAEKVDVVLNEHKIVYAIFDKNDGHVYFYGECEWIKQTSVIITFREFKYAIDDIDIIDKNLKDFGGKNAIVHLCDVTVHRYTEDHSSLLYQITNNVTNSASINISLDNGSSISDSDFTSIINSSPVFNQPIENVWSSMKHDLFYSYEGNKFDKVLKAIDKAIELCDISLIPDGQLKALKFTIKYIEPLFSKVIGLIKEHIKQKNNK